MSDDFKMTRTPNHMTDTGIHRLNAETLLGNKPCGYVIDLRRKYAFQFRMVGRYARPQYECIDTLTYDPDPDSEWHLIGFGSTEGEAQGDLLEKIAYQVAHE